MSRKSNPKLSEEDQWFVIWEIIFPKDYFPGLRRPISAYMDAGLSMEMYLFREYCANYGPSVLTEQIESDPAFSRLNITAEQRRMYLDRVFAQGIDSLFEGYMRSTLSSELVSPLRQNNANMPPTPTPTGSIADSGVALGSQHSSMETTSQKSLLDQPPNIEDLNYQPTLVDGQVQANSTIQESAIEPSQSYGENMLDMSQPDMSFDY